IPSLNVGAIQGSAELEELAIRTGKEINADSWRRRPSRLRKNSERASTETRFAIGMPPDRLARQSCFLSTDGFLLTDGSGAGFHASGRSFPPNPQKTGSALRTGVDCPGICCAIQRSEEIGIPLGGETTWVWAWTLVLVTTGT